MIHTKYTQSTLNITFDFGNTNGDSTLDTLNTTTQGTNFHYNPAHSSSCKRIYSPFSDPYTWRRPEEPEDCSRADIKKACRLGRAY